MISEEKMISIFLSCLFLCFAYGDLAPAAPAPAAQGQDKYSGTIDWGITNGATTSAGPTILGVAPDGPVAKAGIMVGDVIVAIDGDPVKDSAAVQAKIKASRPYTPVTMTVLRSGQRLDKRFIPTGAIRLELKEIDRTFTIPGVPAAAHGPSSALDALDSINVLKEVVIDPASGDIAVIGSYDPKYNTGPINYLDLLKTALKYPEPALRLNPEKSSLEAVAKYDNKNFYNISSPALLILGMPAAEQERQLLIRKLAAAYGITPQEYIDLYNFAYLQTVTSIAPQEIGKIIIKVFRHAGWDKAAAAYEKISGRTADSYAQALKILGWETESNKVLADTTKDAKKRKKSFSPLRRPLSWGMRIYRKKTPRISRCGLKVMRWAPSMLSTRCINTYRYT
ncbi:MAG: PDZ domain-containing protein [Candidatus Omnitrophica bacterium]|nr:PDZ domain-containing protein [Candidatus Omnitrophota bacterium]MCM8791097.1 PDZ domain-containing protein [Candidatus Omnitrophota bacterium]